MKSKDGFGKPIFTAPPGKTIVSFGFDPISDSNACCVFYSDGSSEKITIPSESFNKWFSDKISEMASKPMPLLAAQIAMSKDIAIDPLPYHCKPLYSRLTKFLSWLSA